MADNDKHVEIQNNSGTDLNKYLIINIISTVILCMVSAGVTFFVVENVFTQKMNHLTSITQEEIDEGDENSDEIQKGIIIDLGDFVMNLCDETQKKYLKVNVAIEVTQKETDFPQQAEKPAKGGHAAIEGNDEDAEMDAIQKEMMQYKPAIRDAVITNLSSKTSAELSSAAGKELAKEQITNDINSILGGEREVLRVSFGQFIIQ